MIRTRESREDLKVLAGRHIGDISYAMGAIDQCHLQMRARAVGINLAPHVDNVTYLIRMMVTGYATWW